MRRCSRSLTETSWRSATHQEHDHEQHELGAAQANHAFARFGLVLGDDAVHAGEKRLLMRDRVSREPSAITAGDGRSCGGDHRVVVVADCRE